MSQNTLRITRCYLLNPKCQLRVLQCTKGVQAPWRRKPSPYPAAAIAPAESHLYKPRLRVRICRGFASAGPDQKRIAHGYSKYRHHRPCRPWQNHAGRPIARSNRARSATISRCRNARSIPTIRSASAESRFSRNAPASSLARHAHQHRRYAGPRRFRRRGRAHPLDGRWRGPLGGRCRIGRCRRPNSCSSKALKLGLKPIVIINKIDRSDARARRDARGDLRSLLRARSQRLSARLPCALRLGPAGLGRRRSQRPARKSRSPLFERIVADVPAPKPVERAAMPIRSRCW